MLLQAAMAAAKEGDAIAVRDLIREATAVAARIRDSTNHHRLPFGMTNVGEHVRRRATPAVVDVLKRYPAAPPSGGRVGELLRDLDEALRGRP